MMKLRILYQLICVLVGLSAQAQNESEIITISKIETDVLHDGAIGIKIECTSDFQFLYQLHKTDSLYRKASKQAKFNIHTTIFERENQIQPSYGYNSLKRKDGNFEIKTPISVPFSFSDGLAIKTIIFIPYASMKLAPMPQSIQINLNVNGRDALSYKYNQTIKTEQIRFEKPPTKTFTLVLDSIIVKPTDSKGQGWDYTFSNGDAPDLDLNLMVGGLSVGNIHKGNSYFLHFDRNPRVFNFHISENDEVTLSLVDTDPELDDPIASWRFIATNMKDDIYYEQTDSKANLRAFHFKFQIK